MIDLIITLLFGISSIEKNNSKEIFLEPKNIQVLHKSPTRPKVFSLYERKKRIFNRRNKSLSKKISKQENTRIIHFVDKTAQIKPILDKNIFEIISEEKPLNYKIKQRKNNSLVSKEKIKKSQKWGGHFSAKNYATNSAKTDLKNIKQTLDNSFKLLPKKHLYSLKDLEVRNNYQASRGLANGNRMILNTGDIDSQKELQSVFIHEMGHVVDLGVLKGKKGRKTNFWDGKTPIYSDDLSLKFYRISWRSAQEKKSNTKDSDFVSGYAKSSVFEDFAETYIFYRLHGEKFRVEMQNNKNLIKKYNFMKNIVFEGKEFQLEKGNNWQPKYIWDATLVK